MPREDFRLKPVEAYGFGLEDVVVGLRLALALDAPSAGGALVTVSVVVVVSFVLSWLAEVPYQPSFQPAPREQQLRFFARTLREARRWPKCRLIFS